MIDREDEVTALTAEVARLRAELGRAEMRAESAFVRAWVRWVLDEPRDGGAGRD